MRPKKSVPAYRLHKPTGQAVVTIRQKDGSRRDAYLGVHDSKQSRLKYSQVIANPAAFSPSLLPMASAARELTRFDPTMTVKEMISAFGEHVKQHYRNLSGKPTTEVKEIKASVTPLWETFGDTLAAEFGPRNLAAVRQRMIELGWCRTLINRRMDRVKRAFKWATSQELIPGTVYQSLLTLAGLQKGRTEARESEPVKPVDPAHVAATLPLLSRHVRAMVELQQLTGMRPGEVCGLSFE